MYVFPVSTRFAASLLPPPFQHLSFKKSVCFSKVLESRVDIGFEYGNSVALVGVVGEEECRKIVRSVSALRFLSATTERLNFVKFISHVVFFCQPHSRHYGEINFLFFLSVTFPNDMNTAHSP